MARGRIDLDAVAATLDALRHERAARDAVPVLGEPADPLGDRMQRRLLAAYALLDDAVANGLDLLAPGHSRALLRINHTILYGPRGRREPDNLRALRASEQRFYEGDALARSTGVDGGVADLVAWCDTHRRLPSAERAAGVYVRTLCTPQLFVEGNHRSAMLFASHELLHDGRPPFVLCVDNVAALRGCSAEIGRVARGGLASWARARRLRRRVASIIRASADLTHIGHDNR